MALKHDHLWIKRAFEFAVKSMTGCINTTDQLSLAITALTGTDTSQLDWIQDNDLLSSSIFPMSFQVFCNLISSNTYLVLLDDAELQQSKDHLVAWVSRLLIEPPADSTEISNQKIPLTSQQSIGYSSELLHRFKNQAYARTVFQLLDTLSSGTINADLVSKILFQSRGENQFLAYRLCMNTLGESDGITLYDLKRVIVADPKSKQDV